MVGKWRGEYAYTAGTLSREPGSTSSFEISIKHFENSNFQGSVEDDVSSGGTRGRGTINGSLNESKVTFVKQMPIKTLTYPSGERIESDEPHHPIYYEGTMNAEQNEVIGTWKLKRRLGFVNGRLYYSPKTKGVWGMRGVEE